jgi:gas vesicle protein
MHVTKLPSPDAISKPSPTSTVPSMSYAGPATRNRTSTQGSPTAGPAWPGASRATVGGGSLPSTRAARGEPNAALRSDWRQVGIFGIGLALGLALGAGAALLAAPQSGEETRAALRGQARRLRRTANRRGRDAWTELGDELRSAARSIRRRRAKRAAQRELARESAAD